MCFRLENDLSLDSMVIPQIFLETSRLIILNCMNFLCFFRSQDRRCGSQLNRLIYISFRFALIVVLHLPRMYYLYQ